MRHYLVRLLTERYQVQTVPDGAAALEAARERRPDPVLSDVMMSHLDGLGLVRALRADAMLKDVPTILLSVRAGEESRVEGLQEGTDDFLIKPFSARELLARVGAHVDLARQRRPARDHGPRWADLWLHVLIASGALVLPGVRLLQAPCRPSPGGISTSETRS